jgi:AcrR family transcriptional regulator
MTNESQGLRERKKARTKRAIVEAALDLTRERGFAAATIPLIAERADVAPRTVSTWFPSKDDIILEATPMRIERLRRHMREGEGDVIDRLRSWAEEESRFSDEGADDISAMRREAIALDPHLQAREREQMDTALQAIQTAAAKTLGQNASDFGPRAFAAATIGVLQTIRDSQDRDATPNALDRTFSFLRAGLDALRLAT